MHTGSCDGPFPATPTVFVGPQEGGAPSCPAPAIGSAPPHLDGVWLQPGDRPSDTRPVPTASGEPVLETDPGRGGRIETFWDHGVVIEVGVGPDPGVAHAIFESIGFAPAVPDTPAAGVCARSANPSTMPAPERLAQRLVLERGDVTLDPPHATDRPLMAAAQAWQQSGPKQSVERYRLILGRYSAKFPARQNPDGSLTPLTQDELAWVVYATPTTPDVAGCGLWGLVVFDARSGQEQAASGYSPGP